MLLARGFIDLQCKVSLNCIIEMKTLPTDWRLQEKLTVFNIPVTLCSTVK